MTEAGVGEPRAAGDDLLSVSVADVDIAQRLAAHLRRDRSWLEVVPGFASVTVRFDAASMASRDACARLRAAIPGTPPTGPGDERPLVEIAVRYGGADGPDLDDVCRHLDLSPADFVTAHTGQTYRVELLGFTPGFAYVGGLDAALAVPRLAVPRARVPAGAVGIAGTCTGLYALAGPGGWPLVGRTDCALFDAAGAEPFRLQAGQRVRFHAAS